MPEEYLVVKELRKSFNDFRAVDGVSLSILKGEIFGLLGPNGAGKTRGGRLRAGVRLHCYATLPHERKLKSRY